MSSVCPTTHKLDTLPLHRLIRFLSVRPAFCLGTSSDSQSTATPLPLANTSPCRVCRGLSPPSHQCGHHRQTGCACATRHARRTTKKASHPQWLRPFKNGVRGRNRTGAGRFAISYRYEIFIGLNCLASYSHWLSHNRSIICIHGNFEIPPPRMVPPFPTSRRTYP